MSTTISAKDSLVARITRHRDDLSPTERRLAEFLIDFPGNLPAYTATELANAARVSNAAVTRFFHRLGYESYNDARRQVRLASGCWRGTATMNGSS